MNPSIQLKKPTLVFFVALACFGLSPTSQAVSPPPGGGYPGGNTAEGTNALLNLTGGTNNTAVGLSALLGDTTGDSNTAVGANALFSNTTGRQNTADGRGALHNNTSGDSNTATGAQALYANRTGSDNTANGFQALCNNSTGSSNAATGFQALYNNGSGNFNAATGFQALYNNGSGGNNTATGFQALYSNRVGFTNTANGFQALYSNTRGGGNTATGEGALASNTTGDANTAVGTIALFSNTLGCSNTANGHNALSWNTTGSFNTVLGVSAGGNIETANNVICIGAFVAGEDVSDGCYIGNIFQRPVAANSLPVLVDGFGKLGTASSSARFKKAIKPMDCASEAILAFKPVTFRYKSDKTNTPQFGLIAEEVAKVNPDLVVRDKEGKPYTVRYDQVNAMLLNEFLKEHHQVQDLKAIVAEQQEQIKALTAGLQKVSAQLEVNKPSPQTVLNNQ
jgi:trimeric autotransporter adhesin